MKLLAIIFIALPLFARTEVLHDEHGNRVAVWTETTDGGTHIKSATYLQRHGKWLPPTILSSQKRNVTSYPVAAINKLQQIVIAWESYDPTLQIHCIESVRGRLGKEWSPSEVVSEIQEDTAHADCQVTLDDQGHICLTWSAFLLGNPETVYIRNACSDFEHNWQLPETVS